MKRSQINRSIEDALTHPDCPPLPPWAYWTSSQWQDLTTDANRRAAYAQIWTSGLGWIVTDFGCGDFERYGLTIFVVHNAQLDRTGEPIPGSRNYAQKFLWLKVGQTAPFHHHRVKFENIGQHSRDGNLQAGVRLSWATDDNRSLTDAAVVFHLDGVARQLNNSAQVFSFKRGQSIVLPPGLAHCFSVIKEEGGETYPGSVILEEISGAHNDKTDNYFPELPHSPTRTEIEEDEPARFIMVGEYPFDN